MCRCSLRVAGHVVILTVQHQIRPSSSEDSTGSSRRRRRTTRSNAIAGSRLTFDRRTFVCCEPESSNPTGEHLQRDQVLLTAVRVCVTLRPGGTIGLVAMAI